MRRLNDPSPLVVSWAPADPSLTDPWESLTRLADSGAWWPAPPPAGTWAAGPDDLAGEGGDLVNALARVPTGRLVVLGERGAGKTMLMVRLVLDLLARRGDGCPVPILACMASWNPVGQDLRDWLGTQLLADYPALAATPPPGVDESTRAAALLASGLILPVLDGLDEVPEGLGGLAISRINDALRPGEQLVMTCRSQQYRNAIRPEDGAEVILRGAAAVHLRPLDADAVRGYLCDDAAGPVAKARWDPVLAVLGAETPTGQVLRTPLMVGLANAIYNPRPGEPAGALRNPAELCNPDLADQTAVESLLFDAFIPSTYRHDSAGRWKAQDAEKWLVFLARHLEHKLNSPDLAWWQLRQAVLPRGIAIRAAPSPGLPSSIGQFIAGALASWQFIYAVGISILAGTVAGTDGGPVKGLVTVLFTWLVAGLGTGIWRALKSVPGDLATAASPGVALARDRPAALVLWLGSAVALGLAGALTASPWRPAVPFADSPWASAAVGCAVGFAAGLIVSIWATAWPSFWLTRAGLALCGRLPWPLMNFLADAHRRGVLRQAGAVYQFRHIELQHRLATRSTGRYTKAIEHAVKQLGSDKPDMRISAVRVLKRAARHSAAERATVMDILSTFIRERSREPQPSVPGFSTPRDVQAAATVIGRWTYYRYDGQGVDLAGAKLSSATLYDAKLTNVKLSGAKLRGADLSFATLTGAQLTNVKLSGANLTRADLTGAHVAGADVNGAKLKRANLTRADLTGASLTDADFNGADLHDANLYSASLSGAKLAGANLAGANLTYADLTRADLTGANLTGANLTGACLRRSNLTGAFWPQKAVPQGWERDPAGRLKKADDQHDVKWGCEMAGPRDGDGNGMEKLIAELTSGNPQTRFSAADALGESRNPAAVEPLLGLLNDEDPKVAAAAAKALGKLREQRAVDALVAVLCSNRWQVRIAAVGALGRLCDPRAVQPLQALLADPEVKLREAVVAALRRIGHGGAVGALVQALGNERPDIRWRAAEALSRLDWRPANVQQRILYELARASGTAVAHLGAEADDALIALLLRLDRAPHALPSMADPTDRLGVEALLSIFETSRPHHWNTEYIELADFIASIGDHRALAPLLTQLARGVEASKGRGESITDTSEASHLLWTAEQLLRRNAAQLATNDLQAAASLNEVVQTNHFQGIDPATDAPEMDSIRITVDAGSLQQAAEQALQKRRMGIRSLAPAASLSARDAAPGSGLPVVARSRIPLHTLSHQAEVNAVAFSPGGGQLASASDDATARVWELATGQEVLRVSHDLGVKDVAFSPDGSRLATASSDGTARLWELATGREDFHIAQDADVECWAVAFSSNGDLLAVGTYASAQVWDLATHQKVVEFTHAGFVNAVDFSPDGTLLATVGMDKYARVWELATGRETARFRHRGFGNWLEDVAFSPDGMRLATGDHKRARVWDLATGAKIIQLGGEQVDAVAFSRDGALLAIASLAAAQVWDLANLNMVLDVNLIELVQDVALVCDVALSPDGRLLAFGSTDQKVRVRAIR
jgi:uncharacterized protein YjbI with pentapeptide repeats